MAKLEAPSGGSGLSIKDLAPVGQHVAVCLRVNDLFRVKRQKFQSQEMEDRDVTRFVFGFKGPDGKPYLVQTYEFTISGAPGSNLVGFLTQWLGQNPQMGWDYAEMLHRGAMLTIQHKQSKRNPGQSYADITGVAPVHPQLAAHVPRPEEFEPMLRALENAAPQAPASGSVPPGQRVYSPPPAPPTSYPGSVPPPAPYAPPAPPPAPVAPPPPPPPAPPRQLSPDGKWELVNNQWVPAGPAAPPSFGPAAGSGNAGADEDVPF